MSILVVGDIILDEYWHGESKRISPEAPVPITKVHHIEYSLGGAANVAQNTRALGSKTRLLGIIGKDESGHKIQEELKNKSIENFLQIDSSKPTVRKLRVLANNHYLGRMDFEQNFNLDILSAYKEQLKKTPQFVVLSDYNKGSLQNPLPFIEEANKQGIKTLIDPKNDFSFYKGAWLLKPNRSEFENYYQKFKSFEDLHSICQPIFNEMKIQNILVTLGSDGMVLVQKDKFQHFQGTPVEVFDVTGAGDTVIASLAAYLEKGKDLSKAIQVSNRAGAIAVTKKGTYTVQEEDLESELINQKQEAYLIKGTVETLNNSLFKKLKAIKEIGYKLVILSDQKNLKVPKTEYLEFLNGFNLFNQIIIDDLNSSFLENSMKTFNTDKIYELKNL